MSEMSDLLKETPPEPMRSESIGKLAEALAKAQLAFKTIVKRSENPFYTTDKKKAMYADLAAVIEATQKPLAENGLVVIQSPVIRQSDKAAGVQSLLVHASGEWLKNEVILPATERRKVYDAQGKAEYKDQFTAQTCGIAITYSRRYSYQSIIGVAAEEDDDGNRISGANGSAEEAQAVGKAKVEEIKKKIAETAASKDMNQTETPQNGSGEVYGILKAAKRIKLKNGKGDALALEVIDPKDQHVAIFCFDNRKWDAGSSMFDLLEMAAEGSGQTIRGKVKASGKYTNLTSLVSLGNVNFDDDGVPVIQPESGE
jgi:hypothetical protein